MLKIYCFGNGRSQHQVDMAGWKYSIGVRFLLFCLLTLLFYFSLAPNILPKKLDIEVNAKSGQDIIAPIQILNKKATLAAQERAAENVQPVYKIIPVKNEQLIDALFDRIDRCMNDNESILYSQKVHLYQMVILNEMNKYLREFMMMVSHIYTSELLDEMKRCFEEQKYDVPEETYLKMARLSKEDIARMKPVARKFVSKLMSDTVLDAAVPRAKVPEYVNTSPLDKQAAREVVQELVRLSITPNKFYNNKATKEAKVQARENTSPVFVKQGNVFIKKGQLISQETYDLLKENDLLKTEISFWPQLGLLLLSVMFSLALFMFIRQGNHIYFKFNNVQLLMLLLIFAINIIVIHIIGYAQKKEASYIGYVSPTAIGIMLITLLLDLPLAYICAIILSIIVGIILNTNQGTLFDFNFGFFALVTCHAAIFAIHRASQRSSILRAGIMVCIFGSLTVLMMSMLSGGSISDRSMMLATAFSFASGLLTSVLVIGLMPFFEVTFGILSALKLVELSNPNHPLLRKLLTETPGTYHHSIMVGNLAEQAAESIGANGLLCRVGAFYHDIGKTKRPSYFIENQINMDNPHDHIDPKLSTSIILAHTQDGAEMLKDYKIPKPIRDIAEQHHGTTLLKYFYFKAGEQAREQGIVPEFTEDDFRYPGPRAQSRETAIVGIADCVEAAVRSLRQPTVEHIESMIQKIVKSRMDDNQFNECDLTLRELDTVAQSLKETVLGIFHSRIEYPDDSKLKNKETDAGNLEMVKLK